MRALEYLPPRERDRYEYLIASAKKASECYVGDTDSICETTVVESLNRQAFGVVSDVSDARAKLLYLLSYRYHSIKEKTKFSSPSDALNVIASVSRRPELISHIISSLEQFSDTTKPFIWKSGFVPPRCYEMMMAFFSGLQAMYCTGEVTLAVANTAQGITPGFSSIEISKTARVRIINLGYGDAFYNAFHTN